MKFARSKTVLILYAVMLSLLSCDFLSQTGNMATVMIPLDFDDGSRAISKNFMPAGVTISGFTISVFGPGMQPVKKYISRGARYVNLQIPAGKDRHFKVEVHFDIYSSTDFPYTHVRSFIGRAIADLKPGAYVGLPMNMHAGATQLLAPDRYLTRVWSSDSLSGFGIGTFGNLGQGASLLPNDLDIASDGSLICVNNAQAIGMVWSQAYNSSSTGTYGPLLANHPFPCLAVDRARDFFYTCWLDDRPVASQRIQYMYKYSYDPATHTVTIPLDMRNPNMDLSIPDAGLVVHSIFGIDVDPFNGNLYITGIVADAMYHPTPASMVPALIKYDPSFASGGFTIGRVIDYVTLPQFRQLNDVIVKDDSVFVLNEVLYTENTLPVLFKFDRNLKYKGGYGTISYSGTAFIPSTAAGKFYHPKRFIAHENEGLYIIDDSGIIVGGGTSGPDYDKIVHIDTNMSSSSWTTYPATQTIVASNENFHFFD
ncbi:MAG: hypothetical protein EHM28_09120 [Spirochaetaceae bacterium]|nr:MAG: hypothetical protein EHM28_09120 [Spirochaetaceae bacterium]